MQKKSSDTSVVQADPSKPSVPSPPAHVDRKIAVRWKEWEGWAIVHLRQRGCYGSTATELARLRQWHRQHVLSLLDAGIEMRLIRKHQLDDPRMTDEVRAVVMEAAIGRQRKTRCGHVAYSPGET